MSVQDPNAPLPVLWRYWCLVIALPPSDAGAVQLRSNASGGVVVAAAAAVSDVGAAGTPMTVAVTVAVTVAALPLPGVSVTASGSSSTVIVAVLLVMVLVSVSSTLLPDTVCAFVDAVLELTSTSILLRSTALMFSLNVRMIFVPSADVVGASLPVVMSVGRTPSTLWPVSRATASWSRTAVTTLSLAVLMVPPLRLSWFDPIPTPFTPGVMPMLNTVVSLLTTVYEHVIVVVFVAAVQSACLVAAPMWSPSCGRPVMSTASLKVTTVWMMSPMA